MDNTPTERALSEMQIQQEQKPKEPKAGAGMAQGIKEGKPAWPLASHNKSETTTIPFVITTTTTASETTTSA